ncbi:MAG: hydrogenase maturation nickel metallochaperone HypA [Gemmatimonadales bacterium]|jgi:hydrogenase nickel incorporation protein HypA/HybF
MHELGIAGYLIEVAEQHLQRVPHGPVRRLVVRIGEMAGVNPDSLDFAFECLSKGTGVDGARLEVERVPLAVECDACGRRTPVADYVFRCAACGAETVRIATGREMEFVSIDADDPEEASGAPD